MTDADLDTIAKMMNSGRVTEAERLKVEQLESSGAAHWIKVGTGAFQLSDLDGLAEAIIDVDFDTVLVFK